MGAGSAPRSCPTCSRGSGSPSGSRRLSATGRSFESIKVGKEDGFNDLSLGVKIALAEERGKRPQMALLADVSLPLGRVGFTDDYVIPKVLLLAFGTGLGFRLPH